MLLPSNLAGPLAGELFLFARLQAHWAQAALDAGKPAAQADALSIEPHFVAGYLHGFEVAGGFLRGIAPGGLPNFPTVVIVHDAAGGHGQVEDAGHEGMIDKRQVAGVTRQQSPLPVHDVLAGADFVACLGFAE